MVVSVVRRQTKRQLCVPAVAVRQVLAPVERSLPEGDCDAAVEIEAGSEEEAIKLVSKGEGVFLDNSLEYSHTLDPDTWTVEEE